MDPSGSLQFIETLVFSRSALDLGLEDVLRGLQNELIANPWLGSLEPATGGLRKVRIGIPGRGKRGGARVYYLYIPGHSIIYLILAYAKNTRASLSPGERARVAQRTEKLKAEWP